MTSSAYPLSQGFINPSRNCLNVTQTTASLKLKLSIDLRNPSTVKQVEGRGIRVKRTESFRFSLTTKNPGIVELIRTKKLPLFFSFNKLTA